MSDHQLAVLVGAPVGFSSNSPQSESASTKCQGMVQRIYSNQLGSGCINVMLLRYANCSSTESLSHGFLSGRHVCHHLNVLLIRGRRVHRQYRCQPGSVYTHGELVTRWGNIMKREGGEGGGGVSLCL